MKKWPKGLSLTYLKKKAPKIPDYTCIQIDNIIEKVGRFAKNDKRLTKAQVTRLRNSVWRSYEVLTINYDKVVYFGMRI